MYPELAGEEKRTSGIVAKGLMELGLEVTTDIGGHGVVGLLRGKRVGPVVAWRADMDAFQNEDTLDVPYKSRVSGIRHVCGHDDTTVPLQTLASTNTPSATPVFTATPTDTFMKKVSKDVANNFGSYLATLVTLVLGLLTVYFQFIRKSDKGSK